VSTEVRRGLRGPSAGRCRRRTNSRTAAGWVRRPDRRPIGNGRTCRRRRPSGCRTARPAPGRHRLRRCRPTKSTPFRARYVWFRFDTHTRKRTGEMLHCVAKPTRQARRASLRDRRHREHVHGVRQPGREGLERFGVHDRLLPGPAPGHTSFSERSSATKWPVNGRSVASTVQPHRMRLEVPRLSKVGGHDPNANDRPGDGSCRRGRSPGAELRGRGAGTSPSDVRLPALHRRRDRA
jgi:hypothetical protein